jgi:hypothetical protein
MVEAMVPSPGAAHCARSSCEGPRLPRRVVAVATNGTDAARSSRDVIRATDSSAGARCARSPHQPGLGATAGGNFPVALDRASSIIQFNTVRKDVVVPAPRWTLAMKLMDTEVGAVWCCKPAGGSWRRGRDVVEPGSRVPQLVHAPAMRVQPLGQRSPPSEIPVLLARAVQGAD